MADILIRGMAMPKDCTMCKLAHFNKLDDFTGCDAVPGKKYVPNSDVQFWNSAERPEWCPLVPLPEGHGRLGDLDALFQVIGQDTDRWLIDDISYIETDDAISAVYKAPTIVPAEGGTEDG